jgi:hypothetical protein
MKFFFVDRIFDAKAHFGGNPSKNHVDLVPRLA